MVLLIRYRPITTSTRKISVEMIKEGVRFVLRLSRGCTIPEIMFMRPGESGGLI